MMIVFLNVTFFTQDCTYQHNIMENTFYRIPVEGQAKLFYNCKICKNKELH